MADVPEQIERGFTTFCVKPAQFADDPDAVGALCSDVMRRVAAW